jgi:hypothetical protein
MARSKISLTILSHPNSGYSMLKTSEMLKQCIEEFRGNNKFLRPYGGLSHKFSNSKITKFIRYVELYIIFPFQIIFTRMLYSIDKVLLVDHSDAMHLYYFPDKVATTIVHDQFAFLAAKSMIPGTRIRFSGRVYQTLIHVGLKRSRRFLAVSDSTKKTLIELKFTQEIKTLNLTWNPWQPDKLIPESMINFPNDYAILVSPYSWRKNRPLAINSILELRKFPGLSSLHLLIVGDELSLDETSKVNSAELQFVSFVQGVSDKQLKKLYENSRFCIVTSKYEGYGLPILEANSLGIRCLHNELPSFMEITNSHNIVVKEPLENNDWPAIARLVQNFEKSSRLAEITNERFGYKIFKTNLNREYFL